MSFRKERKSAKQEFDGQWANFVQDPQNKHLFSEDIWRNHGGVCKIFLRHEEIKQGILQELANKYPNVIKTRVVQKNDIIGNYDDIEYYIQSFSG
jgi:hypothetical protein